MLTIGTARVVEDAECRFTPSGKAITTLKLAFNYGKKKEGETYAPSQFIKAIAFNEFAEKLAPKALKGRVAYVELKNLHNEIWTDRNGKEHVDLTGFIQSCTVLAWPQDDEKPQRAPASAPRQAARQATKTNTGFDDMDYQIPF